MKKTWKRAGSLAGMIVALVWICAPGPGVTGQGGPSPLAKGWGRIVASGTITGVDRDRNTLTFALAPESHVDWFQGGTAWRRETLAGTRRLRLLPATLIVDAGGHGITLAAIRPGLPAMLWAVAQPDMQLIGVIVEIASPRVTTPAVPSGSVSRAGVVVGRSGSMIDLLTSAGSRRSIIVTGATVIRVNGQAVPPAAVAPYDVLEVGGPLNSDGSLAATRIDISFSAPDAARVSGPVEQVIGGLGGLVVAQTMISTSADTYVLRDSARADLSQAVSGQPMVVYGIPLLDGATPIGLAARVVVIR